MTWVWKTRAEGEQHKINPWITAILGLQKGITMLNRPSTRILESEYCFQGIALGIKNCLVIKLFTTIVWVSHQLLSFCCSNYRISRNSLIRSTTCWIGTVSSLRCKNIIDFIKSIFIFELVTRNTVIRTKKRSLHVTCDKNVVSCVKKGGN